MNRQATSRLGGLISALLPAVGAASSLYGSYARVMPTASYLRAGQDVSRSVISRHGLAQTPTDTVGQIQELVIIDGAVSTPQLFQQFSRPGIDVVVLDANRDGIAQFNEALAPYRNLDALHVVSHAVAGEVLLGNRRLDQVAFSAQPAIARQLSAALSTNGDVLFYGCELAGSPDGENFLLLVAGATGLDVAASTDITGNPDNNGDWDLELTVGSIEHSAPFAQSALRAFDDVLAINDATGKTITTDGFPTGYAASKAYDVDGTGFVLSATSSPSFATAFYAGLGSLQVDTAVNLDVVQSVYIEFSDGSTFDIDSLKINTPIPLNSYRIETNNGDYVIANGPSLGYATQALNFTNVTRLTITNETALLDGVRVAVDDLIIKNATAPDTAAPAFQNGTPTLSGTAATQTTLTVQFDETGEAHYVVVPDGATAPSAAQVRDGLNSAGAAAFRAGTITVSAASTDFTATISALAASTSYDVYVVTEDALSNLQTTPTQLALTTSASDGNGSVTGASGISEPVSLAYTVDTVGEAIGVFDFTLVDGGGDLLALGASQIRLSVSGTSTDLARADIVWRLDGPDVSQVTGTYDGGTDTITFSGLNISVADNSSEVYTLNAYYGSIANQTGNATILLNIDGDSDITLDPSGTQIDATAPVTNGSGSVTNDNVIGTVDSASAPSAQTYIVGSVLDFSITYDEVVLVDVGSGLPPAIGLMVGAQARQAGYFTGSGTSTLTFRYAVAAGDEDTDGVTIPSAEVSTNSSSIVDTGGNNTNNSFSAPDTSGVIVDGLAPTISIGSPSATDANTGPVTFTISYTDAAAISLAAGDVTVNSTGDAAAGSVAVSGSGNSQRTITLDNLTGDGTLGISIAANTASDDSGNNAPAPADSTTFSVDNTDPSMTVGAPSAPAANTGPITYTLSYDGVDVITLNPADVTLNTTGDAAATVAITGSGNSERTVTVDNITGDGTLSVSIAADTARDAAGNPVPAPPTSDTLVVDNTNPTMTVGAPSAPAANTGPITYTLSYDGVDVITLNPADVTLNTTGDAAATVAITGSGNNARTVTVDNITGDGTLSVSIAADTARDAAGNPVPAPPTSDTLVVDNTNPTMTVGAPSAPAANTGPITFALNYDGVDVITLNAADVTLNSTGDAAATVAITGSGNSERTVTVDNITGDGTLSVSIAADTARDAAGNPVPAPPTSDTLVVDNTNPSMTVGSPSPAATNSGPVSFTLNYAGVETITLNPSDVSLNTTGSVTANVSITGSGASERTVTVDTITGEGTLSVSIAPGTGVDAAGNLVPAPPTSATLEVDKSAPALVLSEPSVSSTSRGPVTFTLTYTDADAISLSAGDVTLNTIGNAGASVSVSGSGLDERTVTLDAISGTGTLGISVAGNTASDNAGNQAVAAGPSNTVAVDDADPQVSAVERSAPANELTGADQVTFAVTFSEPVVNVSTDDFTVTGSTAAGASISGVTGTSNVFLVEINVDDDGNGEVGLALVSGQDIEDQTGNPLSDIEPLSPAQTYTLDNIVPSVTLGEPDSLLAATGPIAVNVSYDGADTVSLSAEDVILNTTGSVAADINVNGSNPATITLSNITGDGSINFSLAAGTASDAAGNQAPEVGPSTTVTIDNTAPSASLTTDTASNPSPELSGTTNDPDAVITVSVAGQTVSTTNNGDGTWTLPAGQINALDPGSYDLTLTATDAAGNVTSETLVDALTIAAVVADVAVDNPQREVQEGDEMLSFPIMIWNNGPDDLADLWVDILTAAELENPVWTCSPLPGSSVVCSTNGTGAFSENLDLPNGEGVMVTLTASLKPAAQVPGTMVSNEVEVILPPGVEDPDDSNNGAPTPPIIAPIFMNGFEQSQTLLIGRKALSKISEHQLSTGLNPSGAATLVLDDQLDDDQQTPVQVYARQHNGNVELRVDYWISGHWRSGSWEPLTASTLRIH